MPKLIEQLKAIVKTMEAVQEAEKQMELAKECWSNTKC